ncbi:MAG TPA: serine O-acetyltransferase EpsC [Phnomibacter sp.]|nr:serine O-acetyltransferase EpsC [Phnomibacter sp.]
MDKQLILTLYNKQTSFDPVPSNQRIATWATDLICLLFPEKATCSFDSPAAIENRMELLQTELLSILHATKACDHCNNVQVTRQFFEDLPQLYNILNTDVQALLAGDPAAHTEFEIIRAYPGFHAMSFYRIAHPLHKLGVPIIPRILTEHAHAQTGIDIHPGANIGEYFFIDHGTGIVIGETTQIGNHVKLYQGVTLGALSVEKGMAFTKRHPTVEDNVVIYSGATILGGDTVIGHHSIIGGNVWITKSVAPYSTVYHKPEITVVTNEEPVM